MGKRWSKLQKKIDDLVDPALDFQIHCVKYRVPGHGGMQEFPRYFVTLDGKTIFDWPKDYPLGDSNCGKLDISCLFFGRASDISDAISKYLNAPEEARMTITDPWGIVDIIRAADRRIGRRRWDQVFALSNFAGRQILLARRAAKARNDKMGGRG
jgi:hypothetical protein